MASNQKVLRVKQFVVKKEVGLDSLYRKHRKMAYTTVFGIGRRGSSEGLRPGVSNQRMRSQQEP